MLANYRESSIREKFDFLLSVMSGDRFLKKEGLGNEVPFFICPYPAEEALDTDKMRKQLAAELHKNGLNVLSVDLYDIALGILDERELLPLILESEGDHTKEELKELLQGVLDVESYIIPEILKKAEENPFDLLFLHGVGEVFPYIRSHNVLSNLHKASSDRPTVLFFPGEYSYSIEKGATLELFGRLHDDKYYRAFNIFHREP